MAGATREIIDPVEAAKEGIGNSRRLIAATLDDLSQHHSWLETYHRDERLRAERLRRQRLFERLALIRQHAAARTGRAGRVAYQTGRVLTRVSKRHALAFTHWAAPRVRTASDHAAVTASQAWSWTQRRTPEFTQRATEAARDGFYWSVRTSEQAGYVFRRHLSAACAEGMTELVRRTAPMRRRGVSGWARTQLRVRRGRARAEQHIVTTIAGSPSLARARRMLHRWTIRGQRVSAYAAAQARQDVLRLESNLSAWIVRVVPELRRRLEAHMPDTAVPARPATGRAGRALILRPTTALACIASTGTRLPALYRA